MFFLCLAVFSVSLPIFMPILKNVQGSSLWYDPNWNHRIQHEIKGSLEGAQSDYSIKFMVHYGSGTNSGENVYLKGMCNIDFSDIRFTNANGDLLNYWVETKIDQDHAVVWVTIDYIPASPNNAIIYIYYGNEEASSNSNGENTFIFFDDFIGESLDTDKWKIHAGTLNVDGTGKLQLVGTTEIRGTISGKIPFLKGTSINTRVKSSTTSPNNMHFLATVQMDRELHEEELAHMTVFAGQFVQNSNRVYQDL